jgi:nucleoid-associated protein YgaU
MRSEAVVGVAARCSIIVGVAARCSIIDGSTTAQLSTDARVASCFTVQVIRLCPASSRRLLAGDDCSYTVKAGDTLFNIGKAHGLTVAQLLQYNPEIKDPDHIEVGQVIRLCPPSARN